MITVDLWTMRPPPRAEGADWACLSAGERGRAARYRHEADRSAFVTAQALQRRVVGRALDLGPQQVVFGRTAEGRPRLEPASGTLGFSASRRRALVAVALSHCPAIGVDVEEIRRHEDPADLLGNFLDLDAAAAAGDLGDPDFFAALWTVTEACAKARGTGLRHFRPRMVVRRAGENEFHIADAHHAWTAKTMIPDTGHRIAVALPAAQAFDIRHHPAASAWA